MTLHVKKASRHGVMPEQLAKVLALSISKGRDAAPQPPGLAVEARPFQLQSISFMLENEREGANKKLWSMYTAPSGRTFHYSVALDKVRNRAPDPVRGGILASEMGLGKTVMALGLVLSNPAPAQLPSVAHMPKVKRASKGTLVIAAVSLVGQWADEARAKMNNPNIKIYAYHGQNRKKDVDFLVRLRLRLRLRVCVLVLFACACV